jgi:hypothetical protein
MENNIKSLPAENIEILIKPKIKKRQTKITGIRGEN